MNSGIFHCLPFNSSALYYYQTPTRTYGHGLHAPAISSLPPSLEWHVWSSSSGNNYHAVHRSLSSGASLCDGTVGFLPCPILSAKLAYAISSHNWPSEYALPPSLEWHVWSSSSGNNCHAVHRSLSSGASLCDGTVGFLPCPILSAKLYFTHSVNFSDRDAENLKINGGWQKRLNSRHLLTLMTPKVFTKSCELCGSQEWTTQNNCLPSTTKR